MPDFFEPAGPGPSDPLRAVVACIEDGAPALLFDAGALPSAFFELRSGLAGGVAKRLLDYGRRGAALVPGLAERPPRFREFARETSAGPRLRFFGSRGEAVAWLEGERAGS